MKKIVFIVFIFSWNLVICQNNYAFVVNKSNAEVFKFKLPSQVILTLKGRGKIKNHRLVFDRFKVELFKVRNDSLFIQSADHKLTMALSWGNVESIKFLKQNTTALAFVPYMLVTGAMTVILPFLYKPPYIQSAIYPLFFLFAPVSIIKWTHSKRRFDANDYYILN